MRLNRVIARSWSMSPASFVWTLRFLFMAFLSYSAFNIFTMMYWLTVFLFALAAVILHIFRSWTSPSSSVAFFSSYYTNKQLWEEKKLTWWVFSFQVFRVIFWWRPWGKAQKWALLALSLRRIFGSSLSCKGRFGLDVAEIVNAYSVFSITNCTVNHFLKIFVCHRLTELLSNPY